MSEFQYGCICPGAETLNGELRGSGGRSPKDVLKFYYENCTIVEKNVCIDTMEGIDYDLGNFKTYSIMYTIKMNKSSLFLKHGRKIFFLSDPIFQDLEEIYGYIDISSTALTAVIFKSLRIIRGWRKPLTINTIPEDCEFDEDRGEKIRKLTDR